MAIPEPELRKYYDAHKAEFVRKAQVFLEPDPDLDGRQDAGAGGGRRNQGASDVAARARQAARSSPNLWRPFPTIKDAAARGRRDAAARERHVAARQSKISRFKEKKGGGFRPDQDFAPQGLVILRIDERYEAGQASFDEVKERIQQTLSAPQLETPGSAPISPSCGWTRSSKSRMATWIPVRCAPARTPTGTTSRN
jgi:hypothetical protein